MYMSGKGRTHGMRCFPQSRPFQPRVYMPQKVRIIVCFHLLNL